MGCKYIFFIAHPQLTNYLFGSKFVLLSFRKFDLLPKSVIARYTNEIGTTKSAKTRLALLKVVYEIMIVIYAYGRYYN